MYPSEKAQEFFSNQQQMQRFGHYANYLPAFYDYVTDIVPEVADTLTDRFKNIVLSPEAPNTNDWIGESYGETNRYFEKDKMYVVIKLAKRLNVPAEQGDYISGEAFFHEMLHAVAGYRRCPSVPEYPDENCFVLGNTNIFSFPPNYIIGDNFGYYPTRNVIEEGIVEDWAVDMFKTFDNENEFANTHSRTEIMQYKLATALCGAWNLASNNQLRKEFIHGKGDGSVLSKKTEVFRQKMQNLYQSLHYVDKKAVCEPKDFDTTKIANDYVDLVHYCMENCDMKSLSIDERIKFDENITFLKNGAPLLDFVNTVSKQNNPQSLEMLKAKLIAEINQDFARISTTVAQNINQPELVVKDSKRNIFPAYTRLANKFHLKANISQNKHEQSAREM